MENRITKRRHTVVPQTRHPWTTTENRAKEYEDRKKRQNADSSLSKDNILTGRRRARQTFSCLNEASLSWLTHNNESSGRSGLRSKAQKKSAAPVTAVAAPKAIKRPATATAQKTAKRNRRRSSNRQTLPTPAVRTLRSTHGELDGLTADMTQTFYADSWRSNQSNVAVRRGRSSQLAGFQVRKCQVRLPRCAELELLILAARAESTSGVSTASLKEEEQQQQEPLVLNECLLKQDDFEDQLLLLQQQQPDELEALSEDLKDELITVELFQLPDLLLDETNTQPANRTPEELPRFSDERPSEVKRVTFGGVLIYSPLHDFEDKYSN